MTRCSHHQSWRSVPAASVSAGAVSSYCAMPRPPLDDRALAGKRPSMTVKKLRIAGSALCVGGLLAFTSPSHAQAPGDRSIRPFTVQVPQAALDELRRRIAATQWPDQETVNDGSQGPRLTKFQETMRYWGTNYDWRKVEARLNALPSPANRRVLAGIPTASPAPGQS